MARNPKTPKNSAKSKKTDDVVVEPADAEDGADAATNGESTQSEDAPVVIEAEVVEVTDDIADEAVEALADAVDEAEVEPVSTDIVAAPEPRRGSFIPMLLGGLAAGVIGFLAASFGPDGFRFGSGSDELASGVETNAAQIETLEARVEAIKIPEPVDLTAIDGQVASLTDQVAGVGGALEGVQSDIGGKLTALGEQLTALDGRLRALEEQPERGDGSSARAAAARDELEAFRGQLDQLIANAEAQVAEAQVKAAEVEQVATETAEEAERRADLAALRAAVDSGSGFSEALAKVGEVPEALAELAEEGVPTITVLQQGFPDAARAALASVQTVPSDASAANKLTAFLKRQTNARSLAPREGTDPDAVLSRAEARLIEGDLNGVLTEVLTLPEPATNAMSDWLAKAEARMAALQAVDELFAATK